MEIPTKKSFFSCCNADVVDGKNIYERVNKRAIKVKYNIKILNEKTDDDIEKEKDNNENINDINLKSTENNNNIKIIKNIDIKSNIYDVKENEDINNKEKKEDKKDEGKKEETKKEIIKDYNDNDFEKRSHILSNKRKNMIENINGGIKYIQTSPESNSKNMLDNKSIKILKNIYKKTEKSKKDSESVVIVEDESEKK